MRGRRRFALAAVLAASIAPCPARSPRTGDLAFTFYAGSSGPGNDDRFRWSEALALSVETYWTGANSLRGTLGSLDLPAHGDSDQGSVSALYVTANIAHNWLRGSVFPYVTGGIGLYAREESAGPLRDHDSVELGVNGGLGAEFRLRENLSVRLEGVLHAVTGPGPSTLAVGRLGITFYY